MESTSEPEGPDIRDDAFEVYLAEASRLRLAERTGPARLRLRSGHLLTGTLTSSDPVEGFLRLEDRVGQSLLISQRAIVSVVGAGTGLRDESGERRQQTLASLLRSRWGERVRALVVDGRWIEGGIHLVAADHVEISMQDELWVIPFASVDIWDA